MADDFQEKTEQPTPKKLDEARQKGDVAKSMEVNSALSLLFGLLLLTIMGSMFYRQLSVLFYKVYSGGYMVELTPVSVMKYFVMGMETFGLLIGAFMGAIMVIGVAASIMQVGFLFTLEPITPKFSKINPGKGFKKIIFSKRSLVELAKNLVKLVIIVWIAYSAIMSYKTQFVPLLDQNTYQMFTFMLKAGSSISFRISMFFLFVAAADYAFQKWEHTNQLKMSRQEIKDEGKQTEGNPQIKSKIRQLQIQMSRSRMMQAVPEADVVITNPTHYAVALQYNPEKDGSPKVVAKGKNLIAQKIKEIAKEHNIPIVEDPPLARAIFSAVDVDRELPAKFFQAVAEVLAYVYKLKKKKLN